MTIVTHVGVSHTFSLYDPHTRTIRKVNANVSRHAETQRDASISAVLAVRMGLSGAADWGHDFVRRVPGAAGRLVADNDYR